MTTQPKPRKDWVAIIKRDIENSEEFREAKAYSDWVKAGIQHFENFFQVLEEKSARGEYIDPKAFEKEVCAYPDKISAPVIADIMMTASLARYDIKQFAEKRLDEALAHITDTHARAMDAMETRIMHIYRQMMTRQEERLARIQGMEEEQDINYMRAVTLWEDYESLKYVPSWSPAQQIRNLRNIFRRQVVQREAMAALSECKETHHRDERLTEEIIEARRESCRDLKELRDAFRNARDKIEKLDFGDMDVFDSRLQQEVNTRTARILTARMQALYPGPFSSA